MEIKKKKYFIMIFLLLVVIIYTKIPISNANHKVGKKWFDGIDSLNNICLKKSFTDNTKNTSLEIKHNLMFPLGKYRLLVSDVYSDVIHYYGEYKSKIDININYERSMLDITLINKDSTVFLFGGKGYCFDFKDTGRDIIKKRNIKVTLYAFLRDGCQGRYKLKIPLTKSEYKDVARHN